MFLTALLHFIKTTYETLHEKSGFPSDRAWALVSKLVYCIFADMNKVRGGVKVASKMNDPRLLCSVVLYSVLRTMDVQQGYLRHNISDHPSISSEYKVGALEANVTKVQIEVSTLKLDVAKASKVADLASNKANEALLAAKKVPEASLGEAFSGPEEFKSTGIPVQALAKAVQVTEERRVYRRQSIQTNAVIVCQEWPGWLFSLGPLGWGNIYVFCDIVLDESIRDYLGDIDWIKGWTCVEDIVSPGLLPPRE
eukprot:scaffold107730_cov49-Attheya_sp.AAC.1